MVTGAPGALAAEGGASSCGSVRAPKVMTGRRRGSLRGASSSSAAARARADGPLGAGRCGASAECTHVLPGVAQLVVIRKSQAPFMRKACHRTLALARQLWVAL